MWIMFYDNENGNIGWILVNVVNKGNNDGRIPYENKPTCVTTVLITNTIVWNFS